MGAHIVLGVSGGIAAYKAVVLLRLLRESGHDVRVVPTEAALAFVGRATWEALSGQPARTDVFEGAAEVEHVALGRTADLLVVAPATADLIARAATGRADDLLTATLLTVTCPVLMAPAMHTEMWQHPATVANVALLRSRGVHVLDPESGRLTGADSGPGRLPEPETLAAAALALLDGAPTRPAGDVPAPAGEARGDLAGRRVLVTAGGTREAVDPVRYLGNRSSGRQGLAIAAAAARRGADVRVVAADISAPVPAGVAVERVESAEQMREAVRRLAADSDVVVMAAAVADFRPVAAPATKIKKAAGAPPPVIELAENPDILAELVTDPPNPGAVVVGFAAETGDAEGSVLDHGRAKARRKGADLLAVNAVGADTGFGDVDNEVTILDAGGEVVGAARGSKEQVADGLLDVVVDRLAAPRRPPTRGGRPAEASPAASTMPR
jgi:phosphopantothenoylcysteine decarboxylase/phosphopantothenate--cysteine ligase